MSSKGIKRSDSGTPDGAGYQTGGMWKKGGFFMICS